MIAQTAEVTLEEVLENREQRVLRQRSAIQTFSRPALSVTVINPGPVKDSLIARQVITHALEALDRLIADRGWPALFREVHMNPTGPEALLVVGARSRELKEAAIRMEDEHPLGRLWDIDVIDPAEAAVTRRGLGLPSRRCLLCGEDAHACARSRAHPLRELQETIQGILNAYREL